MRTTWKIITLPLHARNCLLEQKQQCFLGCRAGMPTTDLRKKVASLSTPPLRSDVAALSIGGQADGVGSDHLGDAQRRNTIWDASFGCSDLICRLR